MLNGDTIRMKRHDVEIFVRYSRLLNMLRILSNYKTVYRLWVWLRRCGHSRGFGVQSPWAYSFIRYVINEHYPYYAYEELDGYFKQEDAIRRKLGKLYFRVANFAQPACWGFCSVHFNVEQEYVKRGCMKTLIQGCLDGNDKDKVERCDVLVMTFENDGDSIFDWFANHAHQNSILIVEHIHSSRKSLRFWEAMIEDERCGISFDLYYCGLVFFDRSMHKHQYIVNF